MLLGGLLEFFAAQVGAELGPAACGVWCAVHSSRQVVDPQLHRQLHTFAVLTGPPPVEAACRPGAGGAAQHPSVLPAGEALVAQRSHQKCVYIVGPASWHTA